MGEDLSQASGRGVEIELGGKKRMLSPLTMGDLADFQAHIRSERLRAVRLSLDGLSADVQQSTLVALAREPVDSVDMDREMSTPAGARYLVWSSLRKADKSLTLEIVGNMVTNTDVDRLIPLVQSISGVGEENPTKAE